VLGLALGAFLVAAIPANASADPVIAAAGDIACDPDDPDFNGGLGSADRCRQKYTSDLLVNAGLSAVLALGDVQYSNSSLSRILASYDPSWGRVKSITHPALGNHESSGTGYFDYFNGKGVTTGPAGERGKGWYSLDVGSWHLIALNSNCSRPADTTNVVDCSSGSEQEQWLRADLAAHRNTCTLAYWHHPRFSSGHDGDSTFMQALWQDLYDAGVDVALSGHSHNYERFAPQNVTGGLDRANGIRQFVGGGTGAFFTGLSSTVKPNSEVRQNKTYGVLKLTLHPTSYDWQFVPEAGKTWTDSGSDLCHGGTATPDTQPPSAPANLTANAPTSSRVDLNWNAAIDDVGVTGYEIYRDGALLGTTAATSYVDATVSPGTTYSYQVRALDAAGNRSAFSDASATTPPDTSTTRTFPAQADARVVESTPTTNYATSHLRVDAGSDPDVESYLRFDVTGISTPVLGAKLRLFAYTGTANGPAVYGTASAWSETGITWANRPARTTGAMDDKGSIPSNSWVEHEVTSYVTGNGTYSFVAAGTSSDGVDMNSREAATNQPELLLTVSQP
jgi:acid phosphatase type 7